MAVTLDIIEAHYRPMRVMQRQLDRGQREERALALLMVACVIMFMSQWPWHARQSHLNGAHLTDAIQNDAFALIFLLPLLSYGIAALTRLVAMIFRGKGTWYASRLALFWAMLASSPLLLLSGLVKGFIGLGPQNTMVGAVWFAVFMWIWLGSLIRAERG